MQLVVKMGAKKTGKRSRKYKEILPVENGENSEKLQNRNSTLVEVVPRCIDRFGEINTLMVLDHLLADRSSCIIRLEA